MQQVEYSNVQVEQKKNILVAYSKFSSHFYLPERLIVFIFPLGDKNCVFSMGSKMVMLGNLAPERNDTTEEKQSSYYLGFMYRKADLYFNFHYSF